MGLLAVLLVTVLCASHHVDAARILMVPFGNWSHFMELDGVGQRLLARNHEVFLLLDGSLTVKTDRYHVLTYQRADSGFVQVPDEVQMKFVESTNQAVGFTLLHKMIKTYCTGMVSDKELFPRLVNLKFDLVLVDNFLAPCPFLVPYKIGVPFVAIASAASAFFMRLPVLPSVVEPLYSLDMFGITFCDETSDQNRLMRRLCRLLAHLVVEYSYRGADTDYLREYVEFPSIEAIRENATLTLVNRTPLLFSPLPKLPHVEYVGGLTTGPAKPLPKELSEWMSEASNVVVVSFGSRFASLPASMVEKLFTAFKQLNQYRFLMRFKQLESNKGVEMPANVKTLDWLPQNDALGHKSTVAFITHSGNNGQLEALYHGVPMLCFYLHADQKPNARRVVNRGYGKMMNIHDYSVEELIANMKDLLENSSYSQRIKKASLIFHSEKHPAERAADAIEHVLKHGGDHLRPKEAYKLNWWQFYMLDILAILYVAFLMSMVLFFVCAKCCLSRVLRRCRGQSSIKAKKD